MKVVVFQHPPFLGSMSMPRFAAQLVEALRAQGHEVTAWAPQPVLHPRFAGTALAKWAGYVDQYLLFPRWVKRQLARLPPHTLFVFADQALGPWVPLVAHRPHVVHVHDLLALRSALGLVPQNPTRWSGRVYQRYIRRGFEQARRFICISQRTRADLLAHSLVRPEAATVVHNELNHPYRPLPAAEAGALLQAQGLQQLAGGFFLHVSGKQWYKNSAGLLGLYAAHARRHPQPLPLVLVGPFGPADAEEALLPLPPQARLVFLQGLGVEVLQALYSQATGFIFPSHAEGFGWPILEAQACGCPVLTTDDTPMNEIGGPHTAYLPRLTAGTETRGWCEQGADVLDAWQAADPAAQAERRAACVAWAARFAPGQARAAYEAVYRAALQDAGQPAD